LLPVEILGSTYGTHVSLLACGVERSGENVVPAEETNQLEIGKTISVRERTK